MSEHDSLCLNKYLSLPADCRICQAMAAAREDERRKMIGSAIWKISVEDGTTSVYLHTTPADTQTRDSGLTVHRDAYLDIDDLGRVTGVEIFDWPLE